ncbi:MAG: LPS export ABC transporter periplasmic protein LptC [Bacteroidales bacterium]|nr:LPS export ABC transporter periplasmic protein LptC [Bacteroidales bacterium]MBN2763878.1 LPS export ABC transporter periplasmic protein LptC [Bacteroidales bacterium]
MKTPGPGSESGHHINLAVLLIAGCIIFSCSCENDIATIKALHEEVNMPTQTGVNVEIIYSDSGLVKGKIIAPELKRFSRENDPYYEFPKGLKVLFYDRNGNVESHVQANYALYFEKQELWEARNNVIAKNEKTNEQLFTEHLFWNEKEESIYSDEYTRIINADGTFYGEKGFEARQDLTKWKLKGSKGTVNVKEEPQEQ